MATVRTFVLALMLAPGACAAPVPEWRFPAFSARMVFAVPSDAKTHFLLQLEKTPGGLPVGTDLVVAAPNGERIPARIVCAAAEETSVLCAIPASAPLQPYAAYYSRRPGEAAEPELLPSNDSAPVAAGIAPLAGRAIPTSWERLRYMLSTPRGERSRAAAGLAGPRLRQFVRSFHDLDSAASDEDAEKRRHEAAARRKVHLIALRSLALCPETGTYRFALDCEDAGFVFVDGEPAVGWPGEHPPGAWRQGPPLSVKAGVHRVDVYAASYARAPALRIGWVLPGRKEPEPIAPTHLVTAFEATDTRAERLDRTLHPGFAATPLAAYSFHGNRAVFVPVQFRSLTQDWVTDEMSFRWTFGDGSRGEGEGPVHIFPSAAIHAATLEVRDSLGFVNACSRSVDCRQVQPEEFAVTAELVGLPAVCFGRDRPMVSLRIEGAAAAGALPPLAIDVDWAVTRWSGATDSGHRSLSLSRQLTEIPIGHARAGDMATLRWRVSHAGVALRENVVSFLRPPFAVYPTRVDGDRLYDKQGQQLVLVPDEEPGAFRQGPLSTARERAELVCVDDTLAVPDLLPPGARAPYHRVLATLLKGSGRSVRYASLPAREDATDSWAPLRRFVETPAALAGKPAIAVLSIGQPDILDGQDIAAFERHTAALTDLVAASLRIPVIWTTPPPYPPDPERSRPYAAAIRRVAEARGIPVADLFTAFRCAEDNWHVFFQRNPLALSDWGHRLAAQQVARTLVEER